MGCAISMVKYILFLFNFLFVLAGIALLAVGIVLKLQLNGVGDFLNDKIDIPSILFIVIGSIILIVAFYGCCGAIRESHCMVTTYAVFMLTILVLEIAIAVLAFVFSDDFDAVLQSTLEEMVQSYEQNKDALDSLQSTLKCCGANGPADYLLQLKIPPGSCCSQTGSTCSFTAIVNSSLYTEGCKKALEEFITFSGQLTGGIAIGVAAVEVVGIVFALCLANSIRNESRRRDI